MFSLRTYLIAAVIMFLIGFSLGAPAAEVTEAQARSLCTSAAEVGGNIVEDYYDGVPQEAVLARLDEMTFQPGIEPLRQVFKTLVRDVYTNSGPGMKRRFTRTEAAAGFVEAGNDMCLKGGGYKPL